MAKPSSPSLKALTLALRKFAKARDWDQFHTPKNLAAALSIEASELLEPFQWLTPEQSSHLTSEQRAQVEEEIGDVLLYLVRISDKLGIDPLAAAQKKIKRNAKKYPVKKSKGKSLKYTAYSNEAH